MENLHKEEMFAGGLWWKEQYRAKSATDTQAVAARSVMLLHHEFVQGMLLVQPKVWQQAEVQSMI